MDDHIHSLISDLQNVGILGKGFILQGDLNAWLGNKLISEDPRKQNKNGKFMEQFLKDNDLTVVNGSILCKGLFTRIQRVKDTVEKSILDFFVVCNRVLGYVLSMNVDEDRLNIPTNYTKVRKGGKSVDSDHMFLELNLDLKVLPTRPTRNIVYNFKCEQGMRIFKELTTSTSEFTECFTSMQPLQIQSEKWRSVLKSYCEKSFPKVRVRTRKLKRSEADSLIEKRNKMKLKLIKANKEGHDDDSLKQIEEEIAETLAMEGRNKAFQFKKFSAENGSVSVTDMWILKKRLCPKKNETIQTGKINHKGKLVTSPEDIKSLIYKEYNERLRPRPEHPMMKDIFEEKKKAFDFKLKEAKLNKTPDWNMSQLEAVLKKVGRNKAQDPDGFNRSIFHIKCIGINLKESLLVLFNTIKKTKGRFLLL